MKRMLAILLAFCSLFGLCACGAAEQPETCSGALASPVYPSMAPQPNMEDYTADNGWDVSEDYYEALRAWREDLSSLRNQPAGYADGLEPYFSACIRQLLSNAGGENRVCSPLNIYMALAMLAEVTDGQSRQQILDLLGAKDLEALRSQAAALWQVSYQDDGVTKSVLASSLWLREGFGYEQETLENLAKYYYASSFRGKMGSQEYDAQLQGWINEQTGGLLSGPASGLHMAPETVLALAATIYFKAPWNSEFYAGLTQPQIFHAPDGDRELDFMHCGMETGYYWGEGFSAVAKGMENGGAMWFLLPDEGLTPEALLDSAEAMNFLLLPNKAGWEKQKSVMVNLSVPKFDVSSDLDLIPSLEALGVTDVLDPERSDFTPLTRGTEALAVSQARHAARVLIDEQGCEAAAYTVIMVAEEAFAEPPEEVDFVLDRPFLFVITNADGLPLFVGLVNHPAE